jgi:hypothetical protein
MDATPFGAILGELLERVPGAFACALVDIQGETVDYAGVGDPFDVKVAAAHLRILLDQVERLGTLGEPASIVIRGAKRTLAVRRLPDGYALIVLLRRRAGFTASRRAYAACERALAIEAGWSTPVDAPIWHPVHVESDRRGRPVRVGDHGVRVEILGAIVGLPPRELGFRVRTAAGSELSLVREARSCWYADEALSSLDEPKPR